jgi:transcriptional regulator with XRE-family HTH domain
MSGIGERVKQKREEYGWSQGELGRSMKSRGWHGYGQMMVSRTENASRVPRLDEAIDLAETLSVSLTWLAYGISGEHSIDYQDGYRDGLIDAAAAIAGLTK